MIIMRMADCQCIKLIQVDSHYPGIMHQYIAALSGVKEDLSIGSLNSERNAMFTP